MEGRKIRVWGGERGVREGSIQNREVCYVPFFALRILALQDLHFVNILKRVRGRG